MGAIRSTELTETYNERGHTATMNECRRKIKSAKSKYVL